MSSDALRARARNNWQAANDEVAQAAIAAGRSPSDVRVIGVSKYVDVEMTRWLIEAGCRDLGESRPQQLIEKAAELATSDIRWHLIGSLQRNKAKRTVEVAHWIHSIDSLKLLQSVATYLSSDPSRRDCVELLVEVNVSGDDQKHGFTPENLLHQWTDVIAVQGARVTGLMAMAGLGSTGEVAKRQFSAVRDLRDKLVERFGVALPHLSMGMSGDFVEAIAAGSTMVRIGSKLFEGIR